VSNTTKILNRIRVMLAKAESTEFAEERDSLTERAEQLMQRYAIDEAMLTAETGADPTTITTRNIQLIAPYAKERGFLLGTVAKHHDVRLVLDYSAGWARGHAFAILVGFPADLELVDMLYTSLTIQAVSALVRIEVPPLPSGRKQDKATYRSSWLLGFRTAVGHRLAAARSTATEETPAGPVSTALVLADRAALVDRRMAELYPDTHAVKARSRGTGRTAGYQSGLTADLGQPRIQHDSRALTG